MLTLSEAQARLLARARALPVEEVSIESALGRTLAEDVDAADDMPRFSGSVMDGYAMATSDLPASASSFVLPLVGENRAGGAPGRLAPGSTCRIFTGAALPEGADAVVPQERVEVGPDGVRFAERPAAGAFVRRAGDDLRSGERALARGTVLQAPQLGLLAMLDRAWVSVARRAVVTVLSTGDEVRAPGRAGDPESVPDASGVAVRALLRSAGAVVRSAGVVGDEAAATERAVRDALRGSDVLVTIGGVSVGDHDRVRPALAACGVELDFWRVALKPGKPLAIGQVRDGDTLVLALPGNPSSALVTLLLFGLPLLRALAGRTQLLPRPLSARLTADVTHEVGRLEFARATLGYRDGVPLATLHPQQSSGALTSFAGADALVALPAERGQLASGDVVDVYPWAELVA